MAAGAAVGNFFRGEDRRLEAAQDLAQDFFLTVLVENGCELVHHENVFFDFTDQLVRGAGQELDQETAGSQNAFVRPDQDAEPAGGRDLFALDQIGGEVLGNLTGNELDTADIWLAHTEVTADR